jgi:hypothetical protein
MFFGAQFLSFLQDYRIREENDSFQFRGIDVFKPNLIGQVSRFTYKDYITTSFWKHGVLIKTDDEQSPEY